MKKLRITLYIALYSSSRCYEAYYNRIMSGGVAVSHTLPALVGVYVLLINSLNVQFIITCAFFLKVFKIFLSSN